MTKSDVPIEEKNREGKMWTQREKPMAYLYSYRPAPFIYIWKFSGERLGFRDERTRIYDTNGNIPT